MTSKSPSDTVENGAPNPSGLLFHWQKSAAPRWRLSFFLIVAAAAHIIFFYLFRVVYPQPARSIPSPERITILSPSNPASRPILAQVADRVSALVSGDSQSIELSTYATIFVPSFKDFELALRIPTENREPVALPSLYNPGESVFPPLAVASPNAAIEQPNGSRPKVALRGELSGRTVVRDPDWHPDSLARLPERRFLFSAGFDSLGRPVFLLPLGSPGNPDSPDTRNALTAALKSLRLNSTGSDTSGTLEITW